MTKVFLSRPNWIAPEFAAGHRAFENVLRDLKIVPQTIGVTHHPQGSPMDAVIEVMDECDGAIVLGYPQLEIDSGKLKSQPIASRLVLATEWNHIEAGLAYARGLPLLVIHHEGVSRSVFDRGALNKFLYAVDLRNESWAIGDQIHPAIVEWKEKIDKERRSKRRKEKQATTSTTAGSKTEVAPAVGKEHLAVLYFLGQRDSVVSDELGRELELSKLKLDFVLDFLVDAQLITRSWSARGTMCSIMPTGRAVLASHGLV